MASAEWEKKNEEYLGEIAADEGLGDLEYIDVLEDLISRAESARDAKQEELDGTDDEDNVDPEPPFEDK